MNRKDRIKIDRLFCLKYFSLPDVTSSVGLAISIVRKTGWDYPHRNSGVLKTISRFRREFDETAKTKPSHKKHIRKSNRSDFYNSDSWKKLRYMALRNCDGRCGACGGSAADGLVMHVDHIKPRSKYPEHELDLDNLQVLCSDCNIGKSNIYEDDWREHFKSI